MAVVDISGGDLYSFSRVTIWFRFLRALAAVAISLTVFEIGHGIYLCATGKSLKAIRYTLLAYGFVLSAISLGTSGAWEQLITDILNDEENFFPYYVDDYYYGRRRPLVILNVIIAVFCMLMSLAVTALSIWFTSAVRHSEKSDVLGQVRYRCPFPTSTHIKLLTPYGTHS